MIFASINNTDKKLKLGIFLLISVLSLLVLKDGLDRDLFRITNLEKDLLEKRYRFHFVELGKLYRNRFGIYIHYKLSVPINKYFQNLFYNLDPNLYFFANHPRERSGVEEFKKFSPLLLPFFLWGLHLFFKNKKRMYLACFAIILILTAFIRSNYEIGPILFFPLIVSVSALGVKQMIKQFYEIK